MTYDDIQKELALWRDFLRLTKTDVSSGQIRNYGNVMNGLKRLAEPILSLRNEPKDERILRACDHLEDSRKELQDIVSDSINEPTSWIRITNRLDDLIDEIDGLSALLAEAPPGKDAENSTLSRWAKLKGWFSDVLEKGLHILTKSFWEAVFDRVWPKQ